VSAAALEQTLRNFDRVATLVSRHAQRQVWRFPFGERTYFLIYYPRAKGAQRLGRVGSALLDFMHLQALQRANIPAVRAVANLSGFRLKQEIGDALVVEGIEHAVALDQFLLEHDLKGQPIPNRREIAATLMQIVKQIGAAGYGFTGLGLDRFLIADGKLYVHDVRGMRRGGMKLNDVLGLASSASRFATRSELLRAWDFLNPDTMPPRTNPMRRRDLRRLVRRSRGSNDDFGILRAGEWIGHFSRTADHAQPWSAASALKPQITDWEAVWPALLEQMQSDRLTPIKRDRSGEVLSAQITLQGVPISVIIKRPRRKEWGQYVGDLFRPARALRTWLKAWTLIAMNLPCEYPLLVMERKKLGYTVDQLLIFERVPGVTLDKMDLNALPPRRRDMLFRRAGRTLRTIEANGYAHYDSKSTNWIVYEDDAHGAVPVMIDTDGIRRLNRWLQMWGLHRLLRAMKQHPQYTPADSLAICEGFAPAAGRIEQEAPPQP
jgi:hypothetical protein